MVLLDATFKVKKINKLADLASLQIFALLLLVTTPDEELIFSECCSHSLYAHFSTVSLRKSIAVIGRNSFLILDL